MKKLLRDKVDLIFLAVVVMFTILHFVKNPYNTERMWSDGNYSPFLAIVCAYIFYSIYRMGTLMDLLNRYVTDPEARELLNLNWKPLTLRNKIYDYVFDAAVIAMIVAAFISLLQL